MISEESALRESSGIMRASLMRRSELRGSKREREEGELRSSLI